MQYLAQHLTRGLRLDVLLRLSRSGITQFDLLGDLDHVTATLNQELRQLALDAPRELHEPEIDLQGLRSTAWWKRVEDFLARYGARAVRTYQAFSARSWREDLPGFLAMVGVAVDTPLPRTTPIPRFLTRRFPGLLADYRAGHVMREESLLVFEELGFAMRRLAAEAARRLGLSADQALFLTFDETQRVLRGEAMDVAGIVARRQAARPRAEAAWVATPHGTAASANRSGDGVASSPGRASGPARVIRGPEEFHRLQPGDVLVCHSTDPAWTPLFARAFGIPAVLGVPGAMEIPDGTRLVVDGSAGTLVSG